jgi:hypothetical protein
MSDQSCPSLLSLPLARGRSAVRTEWRLIAAPTTHELRHQTAAAIASFAAASDGSRSGGLAWPASADEARSCATTARFARRRMLEAGYELGSAAPPVRTSCAF